MAGQPTGSHPYLTGPLRTRPTGRPGSADHNDGTEPRCMAVLVDDPDLQHIITRATHERHLALNGHHTVWKLDEGPFYDWRREGDSNPRSREAQRFSRPSQSSALPSLRRAAYRRRSAASGPPVASGPEERWPSQVEGAPLLREYGPKSSSWVRIPPSPPAARYWADHP